ncbi:malonate decarboxylase holo-ACP synthase [Vibrio palustris]|uniref:Phosphoribosyl-dephospho-CoA transferase n=1 Tax=Vibrio palustris TaxID=1918946 RepID=A0A1R4B5Q3_9VIBR|nr:malonate decarboxylase holo-ACP synthase [Vibrio palustris]SJL84250.1 Phosphoribosyl-dephospho-CoA transferase [Vibrio palustris]
MDRVYAPHDLLWVSQLSDIEDVPEWFTRSDLIERPVVVRRAPIQSGRIAVGIRGTNRSQRHASFIAPHDILRSLTPEALTEQRGWETQDTRHPLPHWQALHEIDQIMHAAQHSWGINGSLAFELATGIPTAHLDSDIDLRLLCPEPLDKAWCRHISDQLQSLPLRPDVQIETPYGAFAMNEWLSSDSVMIKSHTGPTISHHPWQPPHC